MKKTVKRIAMTLVALFALVGATGTALAAGGYITWGGTQNFNEAIQHLDTIGQRGQELKSKLNTANATKEQLENAVRDKENIIRDKENLINSKDQQLEAKQKEIDNLRNQQTGNADQLQQAERDMESINQKTKEVLNSFE